jgi:transcriptional regulator with XRE-family HTH domain
MASPRQFGWTTQAEILERELKNPEFRYHFEQRALVHEVALAVRQMREAAGLTQAQLAALIGVSQPMIARVERGSDRRTPSWDTLRRIAIALGRQLRVAFVASKGQAPLVTVDGGAPDGGAAVRRRKVGVRARQGRGEQRRSNDMKRAGVAPLDSGPAGLRSGRPASRVGRPDSKSGPSASRSG